MKTSKKAKPKSKSKTQKHKEHKPKIPIFESDSPVGPRTEIPRTEIEERVSSLDDARLENPILNWFIPVDLMTELYDEAMGVNTRLWSNQLEFLTKYFGDNFTLEDVRCWVEKRNMKFKGMGWPHIIKLIELEIRQLANNNKTDDEIYNQEPITLTGFLEIACGLNKKTDRNRIQKAKRTMQRDEKFIKPCRESDSGQSNYYNRSDLYKYYKNAIKRLPSLPPIKI